MGTARAAAPTVCAMTSPNDLHPAVWLLWACTGAVIATVASNPLTALMIIKRASFTTRRCGRDPFERLAWIMFAFAAIFGVIRIVLLTLTSHGVGEVWFRLPSVHLPRWLGDFDLGGTVESRVIAQATAEVLLPIAIMCLFAAFNAIVDHDKLMSLIPRSLARPAIVASMALRFFPALVTNVDEARIAARARSGSLHVARRHIAGPALARTLEQSIAVGESMELRGFPTQIAHEPGSWKVPLLLIASAVTLMLGFAHNDARWSLAAAFLAAGAIGLARRIARRTPALRTSTLGWSRADLMLLAALLGTTVFVVTATRNGSTRWFPTDPLTWPRLDWASTAAAVVMLIPMVFQSARVPLPSDQAPVVAGGAGA